MDGEAFVGIDWGSQRHRVCVLDAQRNVLDEFNVEHDGEALAGLPDRLLKRATSIVVGIETRWSAVAETLLERGIKVSPSIQSRSIAFGIGTQSPVRKTIGAMRS